MDENRVFTSTLLRFAREEAKKANVKIGCLITWNNGNDYYEVWDKNKIGDSGLVWRGTAYNASEAKAKYINGLLV